MLETLFVVGLLALLTAVGWVGVFLSWELIAVAGAVCGAAGLLVGLPAGLYYHVVLYRCLGPRGLLRPGWWWSPVRYHRHLTDPERTRVMPWFYTGGIGFVMIVAGCGLTMLGVLLVR